MKKITTTLALSLSVLALAAAGIPEGNNTLSTDFQNPPEDYRISCYWYWISDHLSEEGVVKDLHAMKEAGITRAYIGNIGLDDQGGKVKLGTEEWWNVLHAAMKTATELDIELGVFNSPGWSQS